MNKSQKQVIVALVPIVVLVLTYGIASKVLDGKDTCPKGLSGIYTEIMPGEICLGQKHFGDVGAFDFDKTWWLWLMALVIIGGAEFRLLEEKKGKVNGHKKAENSHDDEFDPRLF